MSISLEALIGWAETRLQQAQQEGQIYFGHGTDNAWDEAVYLVFHASNTPFDTDLEGLQRVVSEGEERAVRKIVQQRIHQRLPAPYLTQQAWFCGLPFYVDERVLVPRSPLGELIEKRFSPWLLNPPAHILDLCTGSGCIGIACAHFFPGSKVVLSDLSLDALAVAEENLRRHELSENVATLHSDLFQQMTGQRFDLIISNPPYVDAADFSSMPEEYSHEPKMALTSGSDGLDFTRRLLAQAGDHLNPGGLLIVEVGNSWEALENAFPKLEFTWLEFERGGHGVFLLNRDQLLA